MHPEYSKRLQSYVDATWMQVSAHAQADAIFEQEPIAKLCAFVGKASCVPRISCCDWSSWTTGSRRPKSPNEFCFEVSRSANKKAQSTHRPWITLLFSWPVIFSCMTWWGSTTCAPACHPRIAARTAFLTCSGSLRTSSSRPVLHAPNRTGQLSELSQLSQKRSLSFTAGIPHGRTAELCPNRHSSEHLHSEVPRMFHVASMEIDSLNSLLRARCQVLCSWVLHWGQDCNWSLHLELRGLAVPWSTFGLLIAVLNLMKRAEVGLLKTALFTRSLFCGRCWRLHSNRRSILRRHGAPCAAGNWPHIPPHTSPIVWKSHISIFAPSCTILHHLAPSCTSTVYSDFTEKVYGSDFCICCEMLWTFVNLVFSRLVSTQSACLLVKGAYINGLFMAGARWDDDNMCIEDSFPKVLDMIDIYRHAFLQWNVQQTQKDAKGKIWSKAYRNKTLKVQPEVLWAEMSPVWLKPVRDWKIWWCDFVREKWTAQKRPQRHLRCWQCSKSRKNLYHVLSLMRLVLVHLHLPCWSININYVNYVIIYI